MIKIILKETDTLKFHSNNSKTDDTTPSVNHGWHKNQGKRR